MMKLLSTTAIVLALAGPAWAAGGSDMSKTAGTIDRSNYPFLTEPNDYTWSSDNIIGMPLKTADGEEIGDIDSLIFTQDDQIAAVVVDTSGFLGLGDSRPVAVDWDAIGVDPDQQALVVNMTEDELKGAPQWQTSDNWRAAKQGMEEVPDVAESQPGTIPGSDENGNAPAGSPSGGAHTGVTGGGTDSDASGGGTSE